MPTWDFSCNRCDASTCVHLKSTLMKDRKAIDPEAFICPECGCDDIKLLSFDNSDDHPGHSWRWKLEDLEHRVKMLEDSIGYEYSDIEVN